MDKTVTLEEAVARMINFDFIPDGYSLLDMTAAFVEEAEVQYENARSDHLSEEVIIRLLSRLYACEARHELAKSLLIHIKEDLASQTSHLVVSKESTAVTRLTLKSVEAWASENFGIGWSAFQKPPSNTPVLSPELSIPSPSSNTADKRAHPRKERNLYVLLYALIEQIADIKQKQKITSFGSKEKPKVSEFAQALRALLAPGDAEDNDGPDFGVDSIRKHIAHAAKYKNEYLESLKLKFPK